MQPPTNKPEESTEVIPQFRDVDLKDLAEILIKHFDYHEGMYDVGIQFNISVGQVGVTPTSNAPGAIIAVAGVGISKVPQQGPNSVDAAQVNPIKSKRRPKHKS